MNPSSPSKFFLWKAGLIGLCFLAFLLTYMVRNNAFFWDTVQFGSIHAYFYLENNFEFFFLPESMDSGHPPFFGMYIALLWEWFGKSLAVSHFAMLPFLIGIIIYLGLLGRYFFKSMWLAGIFVLLHIFDPCIIGQGILVSPDVVLVFFFLMSVYGIFQKKHTHILFGIIGLCMVSTRGMMTVAALFIFDFINFIWIEKNGFYFQRLLKKIFPYIPGVALGIGFLILHYWYTGWIGYHENSPWAPSFDKEDTVGIIRNTAIFGWRVLDFGRVFLCVIAFFISIRLIRKKVKPPIVFLQLLLLFGTLMLFLAPPILMHRMLLGHRYMLPLFILINFIGLYLISISDFKFSIKKTLFIISFLGLATGNLWVYPKKIAQSWDSTLAVLPYFEMRKEMIRYIEAKGIPFAEIGSTFPNVQPFKFLDLTDSMEKFSEKDLENQDYIFYSNVFNDFTDEDIDELENKWEKEKEIKRSRICVVLYRKRK